MAAGQQQYEDACDLIAGFRTRNGRFSWAKFEQLKRLDPELSGLDVRRWAAGVRDKSSTYEKTVQRTLALERWIKKAPGDLLDAMGIPPGSRDVGNPAAARSRNPTDELLGLRRNPQDDRDAWVYWVRQGHYREIFNIMVRALVECPPKRLEEMTGLLPTALYIGYRCLKPGVWVQPFQRILDVLKSNRVRVDPTVGTLCKAQIACALNENDPDEKHDDARELFSSQEVRALWEREQECPWHPPQLIRNVALYWILRGHRPEKAIELAKQAAEFSRDESNLNGATEIASLAYMASGKGHFGKAWSCIEPEYEQSRTILVDQSQRIVAGGYHLRRYAILRHGMLARTLAGAKYPREEFRDDCEALTWCFGRFRETKMIVLPAVTSVPLPAELPRLLSMGTAKTLEAGQKETLQKLSIACGG